MKRYLFDYWQGGNIPTPAAPVKANGDMGDLEIWMNVHYPFIATADYAAPPVTSSGNVGMSSGIEISL